MSETKTASKLLQELSAARSILHDARESYASRKRIWILLRQFFAVYHSLGVDFAYRYPSRLSRLVHIEIEHRDPRVRRLRYKRKIEKEIESYYAKDAPGKRLNPRSQEYRDVVTRWMRSFDEREGLYATMRKSIRNACAKLTKDPYSDQGVAMILAEVRGALRASGEHDAKVTEQLEAGRTISFTATIPSGIEHVQIHARVSF